MTLVHSVGDLVLSMPTTILCSGFEIFKHQEGLEKFDESRQVT